MRRLDSQRLPFDTGLDPHHRTQQSGASSVQSEHGCAANLRGDYAEGCCPHWETAWIDLGGEG